MIFSQKVLDEIEIVLYIQTKKEGTDSNEEIECGGAKVAPPKKRRLKVMSYTKKLILVAFIWVLLVAAIIGGCMLHYTQSQRLFYWQGEKYTFQSSYADSLPEDAAYIGKAKFFRYRSSLGDDLTCNLEGLDISNQADFGAERRGDAYYSEEGRCVYVELNTSIYAPEGQRYAIFGS